MRNPFKNEETAFRFVLGTIAYFALIVVASLVATWLAFVVFIVLTGVALARLRGGTRIEPVQEQSAHEPVEDTWRILVVANETLANASLRDEIIRMAHGVAEDVVVICPALNSQLRTWTSDEDGARAAAASRLSTTLDALHAAGIKARGSIGDGDPLQAVEDALRTFSADAIVVSTHPEGSSNWLERDVLGAVRARYDVPVTHVVGEPTVPDPADAPPLASSS